MAELGRPILNNIRNTNFFNGRLLTATDLSDQQTANRRQHEQLGRATGQGIVTGLEVELLAQAAGVQRVSVQAGLALNSKGQVLELSAKTELALTTPPNPTAVSAGLFADCPDLVTSTFAATTGIYLLVIAPASSYAERAPMRSFDDGRVTGCGDRYAVEGVQFRLVQVNLNNAQLLNPAIAQALTTLINNSGGNSSAALVNRSLLRNRLAYLCFGLPSPHFAPADLLLGPSTTSAAANSSLLDRLYTLAILDACDVPLALLYFTSQGLQFVDMWSVRRQVALCSYTPAQSHSWPLQAGAHGPAVREAMLLQFLTQMRAVSDVLSPAVRTTAQLRDYFTLLPPVGLVPGIGSGFDLDTLFSGRVHGRFVVVATAVLQAMVDAAGSFAPLLTAEDSAIYLFAADENPAIPVTQIGLPYLLFAGRDVLTHFHPPLVLQRGLTRFDAPALGTLVADTLAAYRGLEQIILTEFADAVIRLSNRDQLGLLALQQVIGRAQNFLAHTRGQQLTQDEALAEFGELAQAQQHFITVYADIVLTGSSGIPLFQGIRYPDSFRQMIGAIAELITRTTTSAGITGLLPALDAFDLFAAAATQRAINQFLQLQTGGIPRGNLDIRFIELSTSVIQPGDIVNFVFAIEARTNLREGYRVRAVVEAEQAQAAWQSALRLLDADFQPLTDALVSIEPNQTATIIVQISGVPPNTEDSEVQVGLVATSQRNPTGLTGASSLESFTVGSDIVAPAPDIDLVRTSVQGAARIVDGTVLINPESEGATLTLQATFEQRGLYHVELSIPTSDQATWTTALLNPLPLPSGTPGYNLQTAPVPSTQFIRVGLLPDRTAATTTLLVRVVDANDTTRFREYAQRMGVG